jgi:carbonic anhydrase
MKRLTCIILDCSDVIILFIAFIHNFTGGQTYAEEKGTVILIRCADPRINEACTRLLNPEERPAVISNTGSIKYFLVGDRLADLYGQIRLLVHKFGVKKLILTNHTHCGFYKELSLGEEAELADLRAAMVKLRKTFPEVEVKSYMVDTETSVSTPVN